MLRSRLLVGACTLALSGTAFAAKPLFVGETQPGASVLSAAKSLSAERGASGVRLMRANAAAVAKSTGELELDLGSHRVTAVLDRATQTKSGSLVWSGHLKDAARRPLIGKEARRDEKNQAILVRRGDGITGSIRVNGKLYRITPLGNGTHAVSEINEALLPADHSPNSADVQTGVSGAAAATSTTLAANTIKVSVFASSDAIAAYAGDMAALVDLAVAETNQGYANSGVDITMELAGYTPVTYRETKNFDRNLDRFAGTTDGYMDGIHATRNTQGGDVAVLIVKADAYCGVAKAIGATASTAYAIVHTGCATGYYSFAHEIGHLQSARHDPANDPTNTPYAYGHGYQAPDKSFRTVMGYNCTPSCPRLNYWSNPGVTYGGQAMGTADKSDNHRVLNNTAATIAGFKP